MTRATWRKSSYSGNNGGACVEVAAWRTSSYSSNTGSNCVEVASDACVVAVRDSKDQDGPALAFGSVAWREFTRCVKNGAQSA